MKKLIFLFFLLVVFSCEKSEPEKETCWTCIEKSNENIIRTWKECDILEATQQNGRRWITYIWNGNVSEATVHTINCK